MKKEIKTRQQLIERLNNIDRKCIDEGIHFHDLKTLYESKEPKLSAKDKVDIKRVASIEDDPEVLKSYIDSKAVEEELEEDFYESLKESILTNDEYDYFEVLNDDGLVGEYPTYANAKEACIDDSCHIYGVTQYGGAEYEETLLEDVNYDSFIVKEDDLIIVPFNYYIYYDGNMDDLVDSQIDELVESSNDDLFDYLNSDSVKAKIREQLELEITEIEHENSDIHYDELRGILNVIIEDTDNLQVNTLFSALNKLMYKWKFTMNVEIDGPKRDVDDWDSWDDIVYAEADLDYYEN